MTEQAKAFVALAKAQSQMGKALKKATNPHFGKQYADLGAVQSACMDALHANGFAVLQPTGRDEAGPYVKTIFAHDSGQTLECVTPLLIDRNNMQGLGSAITYARRYGLLCMAGLAPEDDDGNATVEQTQAPFSVNEFITKSVGWIATATTQAELDNRLRQLEGRWGENSQGPFPDQITAKANELTQNMKDAA